MTTSGAMPGFGAGSNNDGYGDAGGGRERGARRKKLAGYLKAANEMRQSYQASYLGSRNGGDYEDDEGGMPGAFPDVAIVRHGDEEMVLFPSYARRHIKKQPKGFAGDSRPGSQSSSRRNSRSARGDRDSGQSQLDDEEFWRREWEKFEQDRAIVDVDVRGWIYSPHRGPMTRKNRLLIGLARQLSGIPAPKDKKGSRDTSPSRGEGETRRDQERIAREAEEILRKGQGEKDVANRGGYSEQPNYDSDRDSMMSQTRGIDTPPRHPPSFSRRETNLSMNSASSFGDDAAPGPGHMMKQSSWSTPAEMSPEEVSTANTHLMARLRPFLNNPLVSTPITVFFYNDKTSQSRTIMTDDAGHFNLRAALDFVPTNIRVLASEDLSATEEVKITEPKGVSVISDVDDTIKHSSIGSGSREVFRNVFVRDVGELTIQGVKELYGALYNKGVGFHYVSNSPWQLYPLLVSFFKKAELPPGSYHLKQYSGMLQGIFEPVAERKKGTLERIMRDFPERRFLLFGDSGEADLEVYTDVVLANPGRIIGVFIRDVTTPPDQDQNRGFFDSSMASSDRPKRKIAPPPNLSSGTSSGYTSHNGSPNDPGISRSTSPSKTRPPLPPRGQSSGTLATRPPLPARGAVQTEAGPAMGDLIDLDSDPEELLPPPPRIRESAIPRSKSDVQIGETARFQSNHLNAGVPKREPSFRAPPLVKTKPLALRANSQGETAEVWNVPISKSAGGSNMDTAKAEKSTSTPPLPPKPRQLSNPPDNTTSATSFDKERDQERGRQSFHPLSQTQNTADLSSSPGAANKPQTWGAYGKQKVSNAYNALPAAKDYIPVTKKASPYDNLIYSAAAKSAQKTNPSIKSVKSAPPPPPPRRSKPQEQTPDTSPEDSDPEEIEPRMFNPSYSSSAPKSYSQAPPPQQQPVSKKVVLWRQRLKRAEETLRSHGVVLMTWRVGEDVSKVAVGLVEREFKRLGIEPAKGGERTVKEGIEKGNGNGNGKGSIRVVKPGE